MGMKMSSCWVLIFVWTLFICSNVGLAFQDADATLPNKPAKAAAAKTSSRNITPKNSGNAPKKPVSLIKKGPNSASTKVEKKETRKTTETNPLSDAVLTINVNPPESKIWVNGQEHSERDGNGNLSLTGLKPSSYTIMVRNTAYREQSRTIILEPKQRQLINILLDPLPGNLTVTPSITGTEIVVINIETNIVVGKYTDSVTDITITPGRYQVLVSKSGYRTVVRQVKINPADSVSLEPPLEPLPVRKPQIQADAQMSIETLKDGKYLVISFTGKSGDVAAKIGALDVMMGVNDNSFPARNVTGMLPGVPCEINFVRIENVAEFSLKESPAPSNQWGKVVVRVRPKDAKRPVHFSINWKALQSQ
jgi:hypothetical protein